MGARAAEARTGSGAGTLQLSLVVPARDLDALVAAYWICRDPDGVFRGHNFRASPGIYTVLCIQLADPVEGDFPERRPNACLTGIQDCIRGYRPTGAAYSVMVFLTPVGAARLFPHSGEAIVGTSPELGAFVGDGEVARLRTAAAAAPGPRELGAALDAWLRDRAARTRTPPDLVRLAAAADLLGASVPVADVAETLELSARHLERIFRQSFGLSPKQFQRIHRLQLSVYAAVTGRGDPLDGFADQAHQIRDWKSHLGITPGSLRRQGLTSVAAHFLREEARRPASFAHYL